MAGDLMNIHTPIDQKMQVWFTAQEFADAAKSGLLPGIPTTKDGIIKKANAEGWQRYHALVKTKTGRGGTITRYHIDLLPSWDRTNYVSRFIKVEPDDLRYLPSLSDRDGLSGRARLERDARLVILRLADRFQKDTGLTVVGSDGLFVQTYNSGQIENLPDWVRKAIETLSIRSLMRWRKKEREAGGNALAHDPAQSRKGSGLLETANGGQVRNTILAWIANNPALAAQHIRGYIEAEFGPELVDRQGEFKPLPPIRTFQHFIKELRTSEAVVLMKITNPDKYRSTKKLRGTGSYGWVKEPNQLWMIDASPGDALLIDGRHSIYITIDVASRRIVGTVSKTPRASAVALMLRKAIITFGAPKAIKMDNGSDFVAEETQRLLDALGVEKQLSRKYTPEDKAFVERAIGTIQRDFFRQVPGYIGSNVAERKAIEDKKAFPVRLGQEAIEIFEASLSASELQTRLDDWIEHTYHQRKHGGLKGQTPAEFAAASTAQVVHIDERALDALLMPVAGKNGQRRMGPQGIKIDGHYYICGTILPGTDVFVRHDPNDMGKVFVYTLDGTRFLDVAICPALSDIDRPAFVAAKKEQFNTMVAEQARKINTNVRKLVKGKPGIDRTIELARQKTAEREGRKANVIPLPKRQEQHTTPQILAALDAMELPSMRSTPKPLSELAAQVHEGLQRDAERRAASNIVHLDPDASLTESARKYKWVLALEEQIARGVPLDDETAGKMARFQATAEYQTVRDMHHYFGDLDAALRAAP